MIGATQRGTQGEHPSLPAGSNAQQLQYNSVAVDMPLSDHNKNLGLEERASADNVKSVSQLSSTMNMQAKKDQHPTISAIVQQKSPREQFPEMVRPIKCKILHLGHDILPSNRVGSQAASEFGKNHPSSAKGHNENSSTVASNAAMSLIKEKSRGYQRAKLSAQVPRRADQLAQSQ